MRKYQYFAYHDCQFETFETEQEAIDWCEAELDYCRGEAWPEETMNICYGKISGGTQVTKEVDCIDKSPEELEGLGLDLPADCTIYQERKILPFSTDAT